MKVKTFLCVAVIGIACVFSVMAQEDENPDPGLYFNPAPSKLGEKYVLFFTGDQADFTDLPEVLVEWNKKTLETVTSFIAVHPEYNLKVSGGTNGATENLDANRATLAVKLLHFYGVPNDRIVESRGTASREWVAQVGSAKGWMNRRVDFELVLSESVF